MKITVHGAGGGEVTGSAYQVQTHEANVLLDLGLFQGARKTENHNHLPKKAAFQKLNAIVLTHAHLDHTGRLPLEPLAASRPRVFLTHGEDRARKPLGKIIEQRYQLRVDYPGLRETIDL
jgi:metallo-beta-lactamase family protein